MSQFPSHTNAPGGAQFAQHRVIDELHQGMVAATFEHPQGWQARSQVVWNFQDTSQPIQCYASVFNPRGTEACEFLPLEGCFWLEPNYMYTPGQKFRGLTYLPPMGALDALTRFAIPKYRGDRRNLRIVHAQPVPNLAQVVGNDWLRSVRNEGVMARVEYEENGRPFEEDFYACVAWQPPVGEQTNWGVAKLFCLRAARGELNTAGPGLWRVAASWRDDPRWLQLLTQILQQLNDQMLAHYSQVQAEQVRQREWGQQMREYREWEHDLHQQTVNDRWASQERINDKRGDVLMGRQRFDDPASPSGLPHFDHTYSRYSWTNGRGDWIHTDRAMYDPNTDPNQTGRGPWSLVNPT
jgi:hypothetical protein